MLFAVVAEYQVTPYAKLRRGRELVSIPNKHTRRLGGKSARLLELSKGTDENQSAG
tara:strand:- start:65 stop:232 length:168 start_codon:yes stop_codon:yes gene_type:complete